MAAHVLRQYSAGRNDDGSTQSGAPVAARMFFAALLMLASFTAVTHARAQNIPAIIGSVVPLEQVNDIRAQPLALLAKFPEAGPAMARFVAKLITHEPQMADSVLSVIKDTSPQQAAAIGAGLVRGARAMGVDQASVAKAIADKVMQSDNLWLKTTFQALGANYSVNSSMASSLPMLPPPALATMEEGTAPPSGQIRLGQTKTEDPILRNSPITPQKRNAFSNDSELLNRDGTLVAIVASDARRNGAVSTSPTQ